MVISATQLQDDLRGEFSGTISIDRPARVTVATDASPFTLLPLALAVPAHEEDLQLLLRYAHEHQLPLMPRGGGTGYSGESLGLGVVVDLSRSFRDILAIEAGRVRVQAGVVLQDVNLALARHGRRIGPQPSSATTCTIGGMVGTNASGSNLFKHGYIRDHTLSLRVAWNNGEIAVVSNTMSSKSTDGTADLRSQEIRSQVAALLSQHREVIQLIRPATPYSRAGYILHDALTAHGLNLARLIVGSEGTLAFVTEAELATVPLPGSVAGFVLGFRTTTEAVRAGLLLRQQTGVVSCEIFDQRLVSLARVRKASKLDLPATPAVVMIVEFEAEHEQASRLASDGLLRIESAIACAVLHPADRHDELLALREFRTSLTQVTYSHGSTTSRPVPIFEDTAVPCEDLIRYVGTVNEYLRQAERPGLFHIFPLTGQVQVRPLIDPQREDDRETLWPLADRIHTLAIAVGGTISSRHGLGLTRTPWVAKQFGQLVPVFTELKRIFDPLNILNPGKITNPDPSHAAWPLLPTLGKAKSLFVWPNMPASEVVSQCTGCGECQTRVIPTRMCPTFQVDPANGQSPRAQVALARFVQIEETAEPLEIDEARRIANACVNCKMCRVDCPSHVDVPKLVLDVKAMIHAESGLNRDDWVMARLDRFLRIGSLVSTSANLLLRSRISRWCLEKVFGIARHRLLPKFTHRPFLQRAKSKGLSQRVPTATDVLKAPRRVAYFADLFANYADPTIGEATVAVLRHHGIEVFVPPRQRGSGVAALTHGDLDAARELAAQNIRILSELIRDGYTVVCSDPTAAITMMQDYPHLFDDEETRLVANQVRELTGYLWELHMLGLLRTEFPQPLALHLGHHVPCHIKATGQEPAGPKLLRLIPGVTVTVIDEGCSGMAGTFGLKASSFEQSLRIGKPMLELLNAVPIVYGSTECGACRMQMQQGSRKRTLHPVQYLAIAYGLLPQLHKRLKQPLGTLATV